MIPPEVITALAFVAAHPWPFAVAASALFLWSRLSKKIRRRARRRVWRITKDTVEWAWRSATAARKSPSRRPGPSPYSARRPNDWTWPVEEGGATELYRYFNEDEVVLYIGISAVSRGSKRWQEHAESKPWYGEVAHCTTETYPTRWEAFYAEAKAIQNENPRYNIARPDPARIGRP